MRVCVCVCTRARVCMRVVVCVRARVCACMYALGMVSRTKSLRFISTLIVIYYQMNVECNKIVNINQCQQRVHGPYVGRKYC